MRRRLSRTELRRQRRYREDVVNQPAPPLPHDPAMLMAAVDRLPRRLRNEINARGIEQDIFDRLPPQEAYDIAKALGCVDDDASVADVWN